MVADAGALLAAAGYGEDRPWVKLGIGLDFGTAFVGNVGSGDVKDFTAIGNVVTTAARLQAAAASGEIVMSSRVHDRAGEHAAGAEPRELSMKGKSEPEIAMVRHIDFAMPPADAQAGSWRRQGRRPGRLGVRRPPHSGDPSKTLAHRRVLLLDQSTEFEGHWNEVAKPFEWNFTHQDLAELIGQLSAREPQLRLAA